MARDEAPPFARGESFWNGGTIDTSNLLSIGGENLEGKEFGFEANSPSIAVSQQIDPSGRPIKCKVVRNVSGVNLKPGRLVTWDTSTTGTYETRVTGYGITVATPPAGIVDEFLPAAGVPNYDLFYLVVEGNTKVTQGATTAANLAVGTRLVCAAYGATAGDDLGGRVAVQDLSGATTPLGSNIQNSFGFAASANTTAGSMVPAVITRGRW